MFARRCISHRRRPSSLEDHRGGTFGLIEDDHDLTGKERKGPSMELQISPLSCAEMDYREKKALSDKYNPYAGTMWVCVHGFLPADTASVIQEVQMCGKVLNFVPGPKDSRSMYILYKDRRGACNALDMDGMLINDNLIIGVKRVDDMRLLLLYQIIRDFRWTPFMIHGSVSDHDEKGKQCHGIRIVDDLPADAPWVCVYRFSAADTDLVFRQFETCGEILNYTSDPMDPRSIYIQYKHREDAEEALGKEGMQMGDNLSIGVRRVYPEQREFLNGLVALQKTLHTYYPTAISTESTGVDGSSLRADKGIDGSSLKAAWYKLKDFIYATKAVSIDRL